MPVDRRAQLFTLDLLLALVPLTIMLGMSANAMAGVTTQIQEYAYGYSMTRVATDAADVLIKTPGEPSTWTNASLRELGFAIYFEEIGCPVAKSNVTLNNILDNSKLSAFATSFNTTTISSALKNIGGGNNIRILVTNSTGTVVDVIGYTNAGTWTVTDDSTTINAVMGNASDIFIAKRAIGILELGALGWTFTTTLETGGDEEDLDLKLKSTPAAGDLDGDGKREIVMAPKDVVYAVYQDGTLMWSYLTGDDFKMSSPVLADLNGDGKPETIVGSVEGTVYAIYHDGTPYWSYTIPDAEIWSAPAVADLDEDGQPEIVTGDKEKGNITVLNHDGTLYWTKNIAGGIKSSPAIADLEDGDNQLEIVIGTEDDTVVALNHDGSLLWSYSTGGHVHSSPAVYDIDGDGYPEVVVGSNDKKLYVLNNDGTSMWSATFNEKISSSPALADLDGDNKFEIIFGSEDKNVYAYNSTGTKLWEYQTDGKIKWSSPAIGDIDGDCKLEVVIGSEDKKIYALNHDGTLLWTYETGDKIETSPIIVDLDGDGYLEVIVGSDDGIIYVITTSGSGAEWPMFHQCLKRAGYHYDLECAGPTSGIQSVEIASSATEGHLEVYIWR